MPNSFGPSALWFKTRGTRTVQPKPLHRVLSRSLQGIAERPLPCILAVEEFLRRVLLHLLPRGFARIRNFGVLAIRQRATFLPLCFQLLRSSESMPTPAASPSLDQPRSLWTCRPAAEPCTSSNGSRPAYHCGLPKYCAPYRIKSNPADIGGGGFLRQADSRVKILPK
jgi:hypothetical protein